MKKKITEYHVHYAPSGMPKNLYLVRHGESEGNLVRKNFEASGKESFFSDEFLGLHESQYRLTKLGIKQARQAGAWFRKHKLTRFDRCLVSNNVRAMETAAYLGLPGAEWMENSNLRERDGGLFNSITPSRRDKEYADQKKFHDTQPFMFYPPQGESLAQVQIRIKSVLDTLARECCGKDVIIVCHGHVMRVFRYILERWLSQQMNRYLRSKAESARIPNCSIIHYTREDVKHGQRGLSDSFSAMRIIRPAGGGKAEDPFKMIVRKKYSNEDLLKAAKKMRAMK